MIRTIIHLDNAIILAQILSISGMILFWKNWMKNWLNLYQISENWMSLCSRWLELAREGKIKRVFTWTRVKKSNTTKKSSVYWAEQFHHWDQWTWVSWRLKFFKCTRCLDQIFPYLAFYYTQVRFVYKIFHKTLILLIFKVFCKRKI